jgi:hypothetical protein
LQNATKTSPLISPNDNITGSLGNRNPASRELHRQHAAASPGTPSQLRPALLIPPLTRELRRKFDDAIKPRNSDRIISAARNKLFGYHFQRLGSTDLKIHGHIIDEYLELTSLRHQNRFRFLTLNFVAQLTSGERFSHLDRVFRAKAIFDYEQVFFPFWKDDHFMLITVLPNHDGRN